MNRTAGLTPSTRWLPVALLPLTALLFEYGGLDRQIADFFYDPQAGTWRWGEAWWSNELLHQGGRALVKTFAGAALSVALASFLFTAFRPWRRVALYVFTCIALSTGLANTVKALSNVDCPWSLERYGGDRPYVHVLADRPDELPRAKCFPAGHAAGGYSLLALYFAALGMGRRRAAFYLAAGVTMGVVFGFAQWARGAHFVSHDLWSAALCWLTAATLYRPGFGARLRTRPPARVISPRPRVALVT